MGKDFICHALWGKRHLRSVTKHTSSFLSLWGKINLPFGCVPYIWMEKDIFFVLWEKKTDYSLCEENDIFFASLKKKTSSLLCVEKDNFFSMCGKNIFALLVWKKTSSLFALWEKDNVFARKEKEIVYSLYYRRLCMCMTNVSPARSDGCSLAVWPWAPPFTPPRRQRGDQPFFHANWLADA